MKRKRISPDSSAKGLIAGAIFSTVLCWPLVSLFFEAPPQRGYAWLFVFWLAAIFFVFVIIRYPASGEALGPDKKGDQ